MKMRIKTCKGCNEKFTPERQFQNTCSYECAINHARILQEKLNKKRKLERHREKKTLRETDKAYLLEIAQKTFNTYIRHRDKDKPCITCGTTNNIQFHAGHYLSVGARPELRFNEINVHKQCVRCNNYLSGNVAEYRKALIEMYGLEAVENLESNRVVKKWEIDEIKEIISTFKAKIKNS